MNLGKGLRWNTFTFKFSYYQLTSAITQKSSSTYFRNATAYCQISTTRCTLVGNKIFDHSDVVGTSPVCAVPTVNAAPVTSSFSTYNTWLQWIGQRQLVRRDETHFGFGIWCTLYLRFDGIFFNAPHLSMTQKSHLTVYESTFLRPTRWKTCFSVSSTAKCFSAIFIMLFFLDTPQCVSRKLFLVMSLQLQLKKLCSWKQHVELYFF